MKSISLFLALSLVSTIGMAKTKKVSSQQDCGENHDEICRVPAEKPEAKAGPADPIGAVLPKVEKPKVTPTPTPSPAPAKAKK